MQQNLMDVFKFKSVDLQSAKNQLNHKTNGLSSSTLVLRRGQAFQILVNFDGQPFDPQKNKLVFLAVLGPLSFELPVSGSSQPVSVSGLSASVSALPMPVLVPGHEQSVPGCGQSVLGRGQSVPGRGQSVLGRGQSVPGSGQFVPGFEEPVPGCGLPMPGFGKPVPGCGLPIPGFGKPVPGCGLPMPGFGKPVPGCGLPMPGFGKPVPGCGLPMPGFGKPVPGCGLPMPGFGKPVPGCGLPMPGFGQPSSSSGQPVSGTGQPSTTQWSATLERGTNPNSPRTTSVSLLSPASASVGVYTLSLRVESRTNVMTHSLGQFTLLCNPWCEGDSVFLSSEELRDEYVRSDFGLLFKGTPSNYVSRPWSFDQYEKGILDICMKLLQLNPQYLTDARKDLLNRTSPVYIGRVISAMVNSQDDKGVLLGNWSGKYNDGVNPSTWSGSADILRKWSESQFRPVKYGQCWVFAAVMCTVMRALGIPTRAVTNFNSAHDTDGNMVIEQYYSEFGEKLSSSRDSIWNFHVWVESWMKRPDLGQEFDGWQVLDPTPQERSTGMYRCGPASLKAIRDKNVEAQYDVPFVYAEVNADVRTMIVRNGKVLSSETDTKSVGALICTKSPGSMQMLNITSEYKTFLFDGTHPEIYGPAPEGVAVSLNLLKTPVVGENIIFNVTITNNETKEKGLKAHVNAQNKEYNSNPTGTFWEAHNDLKLAPNETRTFKHEISFSDYASKEVREDYLVNLAVVIEDVETQKRTLDSQEFNIISPTLTIQIANENSVVVNTQQVATVTFTSPFAVLVNGELTVTGSGLLEEKVQISVTLKPGEAMKRPVEFTPRMTGSKMLQASLVLTNMPSVLHGFMTINVKRP